ncbi:unnamed protein product [Miscanthus lutarioriparius]|uniref:Uncharacterized protein n=1 Tax=Miscanthus lutarioriparius TaxID=422564 RepID=A0A811MNA0_9POAL|nr:unnamed protein product [Miscanthus lutarioriparius]
MLTKPQPPVLDVSGGATSLHGCAWHLPCRRRRWRLRSAATSAVAFPEEGSRLLDFAGAGATLRQLLDSLLAAAAHLRLFLSSAPTLHRHQKEFVLVEIVLRLNYVKQGNDLAPNTVPHGEMSSLLTSLRPAVSDLKNLNLNFSVVFEVKMMCIHSLVQSLFVQLFEKIHVSEFALSHKYHKELLQLKQKDYTKAHELLEDVLMDQKKSNIQTNSL